MIIDIDDPAILAQLNPVELQVLRNVSQRIGLAARERIERAECEGALPARPLRVEWAAAE